MKNYLKLTLFLFSLFFPFCFASAATYPQGSLIKSKESRAIYYVASDGKKYPFPNLATYKSWYRDFTGVQTVASKDFAAIKSGSVFVTVRPGSRLVKFEDNAAIYAVSNGATLHKVADKKMAQDLFGENWYVDSFIVLPKGDIKYYSIGDNLINFDQYNAPYERGKIKTITDLLVSQKVIVLKSKTTNTVLENSRLKSLSENLSDSFSPSFSYSNYSYSLSAKYTETSVSLTPTAYSANSVVKINGLNALSGQQIKIALKEGINIININVKEIDRQSTNYTLTVVRSAPDSSYTLSSLTENLTTNFDPIFKPGIYEYKLKANHDTASVDFKPTLTSSKAKLYLNGNEIKSGVKQTVGLAYGDNEIKFKVLSEDGRFRVYTITVNRSPYIDISSTYLKYIKINLRNGISPAFNNDETAYEARAGVNEKTVKIWVAPMNSNSIVVIDDKERTSVEYSLVDSGLAFIEIQVVGADGLNRKYTVEVTKDQ